MKKEALPSPLHRKDLKNISRLRSNTKSPDCSSRTKSPCYRASSTKNGELRHTSPREEPFHRSISKGYSHISASHKRSSPISNKRLKHYSSHHLESKAGGNQSKRYEAGANVQLDESSESYYRDRSGSRNVLTNGKGSGSQERRKRRKRKKKGNQKSKKKLREKSISSSLSSSTEANEMLELLNMKKKIKKAKSIRKNIKEKSVSKKNKSSSSIVEIQAGTPSSASEDPPALQVKLDSGLEVRGRGPQLHPRKPYFRPIVEIEQQFLLGLTKCRVCSTYYPEEEEKARAHLSQHKDRVFLVTLPRDTFYCNIEEAIQHLANFGIVEEDLRNKVETCNLIKYPTSLKGFSCDICCTLDTNSDKDFNFHLKEGCGRDLSKEERSKHLIFFCRGCHARFTSKADLLLHVDMTTNGNLRCWPVSTVINRLYNQCVASKQATVGPVQPSLKMVQVKHEKLHQAELFRVETDTVEARQQELESQFTPTGTLFDAFAPSTPMPSVYPTDTQQMPAPPGLQTYPMFSADPQQMSAPPDLCPQQTYPMYPPDPQQMPAPQGLCPQQTYPMYQPDPQQMPAPLGLCPQQTFPMYPPDSQQMSAPPNLFPQQSYPMYPPDTREISIPPGLPSKSSLEQILQTAVGALQPRQLPSHVQFPDYSNPLQTPPTYPQFQEYHPQLDTNCGSIMSESHPPQPSPRVTSTADSPSPAFSPHRPLDRSYSISPPRSRDSFLNGSRDLSPPRSIQPSQPRKLLYQNSREMYSSRSVDMSPSRSRDVSLNRDISGMVVSPPKDEVEMTSKTANTFNCRRSACSWTDPHYLNCSKLYILEKCRIGECLLDDKHGPPCPKYQFYCNFKRDSQGRYKYYDHLPQVVKISTKVPGGKRDKSVAEDKSVCMRLRYRETSKELQDPRRLLMDYPLSRNSPAKSCATEWKVWGGNQLVCTWAGMNKVRVRRQNNPYVVLETEEDTTDISVCEQKK